MTQLPSETSGNVGSSSPSFGNVPNASEPFRSVPNRSEPFGNVPRDSEAFRTIRNHSDRSENHTLTVRDAARLFEAAGVARTERSIINWCQPNKMGVPRLDCYFDPNDRKYFITRQSVELAIAEEKGKTKRPTDEVSEAFGTISNAAEPAPPSPAPPATGESSEIKTLQMEIMDLKITNRAKDMWIEQLQREREGFNEERKGYVEQLVAGSREIGEMVARLLQLERPKNEDHNTGFSENKSTASEPTHNTNFRT